MSQIVVMYLCLSLLQAIAPNDSYFAVGDTGAKIALPVARVFSVHETYVFAIAVGCVSLYDIRNNASNNVAQYQSNEDWLLNGDAYAAPRPIKTIDVCFSNSVSVSL